MEHIIQFINNLMGPVLFCITVFPVIFLAYNAWGEDE